MFPHPRLVRRARWCLLPCVGSVLVACTDTNRSREQAPPPGAVSSARVAAPADTDDFGVPLPADARFAARVVSLNPSATEAIFAIGAQQRLVGRSRWDAHPAQVSTVPALGDGIRPAVEPILAARPTLVILYATAENRPAADALTRAGVRVLALRVDRIAHFHAQLRALGVAMGAEAQARVVSDTVQATLDAVHRVTARVKRRPRVVWPVQGTPPLVIGAGSYLHELLEIAGAENVFGDNPQPSPAVGIEEIIARAPAFVVTSAKRAAEFNGDELWSAVPAIRARRFVIEDPAVTGRPSVVLGMAAVQLARALHPSLADSLPRP